MTHEESLPMKYNYDIICIGLGPAGMAASIMGSQMGLNVCAIEKNKIGGECMNVGCIPSKALLKFSKNFSIYSKLSGEKIIRAAGLQ
jgi:pyruvate/2-oxoglutarate dehydrogenase complex dihydrolipoamide dehydrogenase (E3) component